MLQTLRRRARGSEEGFTLIELMVVVLIIAILLAIAIPTFLGARGKAQARGAQSNLRNALTAEKTIFTDGSSFSNDVAAAGVLKTAEPALTWVVTATAQIKATVGVAAAAKNGTGANDNVQLSAVDASGTKCWWVTDEGLVGLGATAIQPGTFYGFTNSTAAGGACPAMTLPTGPLATAIPTTAATVSGTWGTTW